MNHLDTFLKATEATRKVSSHYQSVTLSAFFGIVLLVISLYYTNTTDLQFVGIAIFLFVFVFAGLKAAKADQAFRDATSRAIMPLVSEILGVEVGHSSGKSEKEAMRTIITDSQLLGEYFNQVETDDVYTLPGALPAVVEELFLSQQSGSGKNQRTAKVFHGSLITVQLPKFLLGETYISTEGEKGRFVHSKFWNRITNTQIINETQLEWNEFERDLHVAASDPVEAREILAPDFMLKLHTWWSEKKENIRIVFKGNQMIMLLPDNEVTLGSISASKNPKYLKRYLTSIVKPLERTINLVAAIRL